MNATCMEKVSRSKKVMKTPLFYNNEEGLKLSFCKDIYLFTWILVSSTSKVF